MSLALKHNLTDAAIQDLLHLISYFVPIPNTCITSLYSFKKFFTGSQLNSNRIYFCGRCKSTITNMLALQCSMCSERLDYFISMSITKQTNNFFERPGFFTSLQHCFNHIVKSGHITDIYDGMLYRMLTNFSVIDQIYPEYRWCTTLHLSQCGPCIRTSICIVQFLES